MAGDSTDFDILNGSGLFETIQQRLLYLGDGDYRRKRTDVAIELYANQEEDASSHGIHTLDIIVASILRPATFRTLLEEACSDLKWYSYDQLLTEKKQYVSQLPTLLEASSGSSLVRIWYFASEGLLKLLRRTHPRAELDELLVPYQESTGFSEAIRHAKASKRPAIALGRNSDNDISGENVTHLVIRRHGSLWANPIESHRLDLSASYLRDKWQQTDQRSTENPMFAVDSASSNEYQPKRYRAKDDHREIHYFLPERATSISGTSMLQCNSFEVQVQEISVSDIEWERYEIDFASTFSAPDMSNAILTRPSPQPTVTEDSKMTDARTVLNRIRHDASFHPSDITISYLDRHEGLMTKDLSDWRSDLTEEDFIPLHRIRAFTQKNNNLVLWDREKRIDAFRK